ncbi:MAG: hypothetical protein WAU86_16155 [Oricola sp.]
MGQFLAVCLVLSGLVVSAAGATQMIPPYRDDRSDAEALIRSYYNALYRKEFARAWSYYGEDKPAADFETFQADSQSIASVEDAYGAVEEEGAAGSMYYHVPVAVKLTHEGGAEEVLAGCYVARLANPQIQGDPFMPMHIVSATLAPASGPLESAVPAGCPGA